jgi:hypothetical protein
MAEAEYHELLDKKEIGIPFFGMQFSRSEQESKTLYESIYMKFIIRRQFLNSWSARKIKK